MSEKRFEFKLKVNFIDEETGEEIYHKVLIDNSTGNEVGFDDMVGLLNTLHEENQKLQEKIMKVKQSNNHYYTEYDKIKEELNNLKKDATLLYHYYTLALYGE